MEYGAEEIEVLEDLDAVRKRPSMYIGDTSQRGLHHLVFEVLDNSIDEAIVGCCDRIKVVIHEDESVTVEDNGRGIPVEEHPQYKLSAAEIVLTKLHAGGKFSHKIYKVSGGLHGVGISVVNALSEWLDLEIKRNGKIYFQRYERGNPVSTMKIIGLEEEDKTGTKIRFKPDSLIFDDVSFNYEILRERLRELSFLNRGLSLSIRDERQKKSDHFRYDGGILSFLEFLNRNDEVIHKPFYTNVEKNDVRVEIGIQYNESYVERIYSFVNNVPTTEGGTHVTGFKTSLTRTINEYGRKSGKLKTTITGEDVREGLTAIINLQLKNPQFEGQTKTRLGNREIKGIVESILREKFYEFLDENEDIADRIIEKVMRAANAREAARKAKEIIRKKEFRISPLPGKLADCTEKDVSKREIYIVEGESAGGSAKQARDKNYQAILPIKGKILNVEKASMEKIMKSEEIKSIITALGCGVGEKFQMDKMRYQKVIIMSDADVDGAHIRTLLLTLFYRYMQPLILNSRVYIAMPPLYTIKTRNKTIHVYTEEEYRRVINEIGADGVKVQRYKGLGEMNPDQLWETTMNRKTRFLKVVTIEDAKKADDIFDILMGSRVEPRREFIQRHAREVRNLDI